MILNDKQIKALSEDKENPMISPFVPNLIREVDVIGHHQFPPNTRKVLSYGLSSYGYDLRLSLKEFKIFRRVPGEIVNPKAFNSDTLIDVELKSNKFGDYFILPAHTYGLGVALEKLNIPANITCLFIGKSTYARAGIIWNLTPGESGWNGHLTLEVSNSSESDCMIFANEGVVQALFLQGDPCETSYSDRNGKYQNQPEQIVFSKV